MSRNTNIYDGGRQVVTTRLGNVEDKYDALRDAEQKWRRNPEKYNSESRYYSSSQSRPYTGHRNTVQRDYYDNSPRRLREKITVVVEHWSGCKGQNVCDDIRQGIEDNFPDVKFIEINGRVGAFEVFINGKLLFSRINQGGYPYTEEVLDAVMRAREGMKFRELDRGSSTCSVM